MKTDRMSILVGAVLALVAESAAASMSFDVVGNVLLDRSTGYEWKQIVQSEFPLTTTRGDGWTYADFAAIAAMLPDPGMYASSSDVARLVAFFDPSATGYVGGWFTHGLNAEALPVFDFLSYGYTVDSDGSINIQGWGPFTTGDYSALKCVPPYQAAPPFEEFCNTPRPFLVVNTALPSPVPLPASWLFLCAGFALGPLLRRR